MFNLYNICLLRAFEHIHMEFARYKCLLLLLLLLLGGVSRTVTHNDYYETFIHKDLFRLYRS